MKKRKKTQQAEAVAEASVPTPVAEELTSPEATNPNIGLPDFGESEDTAVNEAPADLLRDAVRPDEWDGPTTEAALTEMAALAAASAEAGGESARRSHCRRRRSPAAWRACSRACCSPVIGR